MALKYMVMTKPPFLWLNGRIVASHEAHVSPFDHGLLVGDGVFETLIAREGKPFAAREHYERLVNSCQTLEMNCISEAEFMLGIESVLVANGWANARVRITLTSGDGPLGSERGNDPGTVMVVATPLKGWPPTEKVSLVPWTRNSRGALAGVKSVSYGENVLALAYARKRGCGEALLANDRDELCEGTGSNVFVVKDGRLLTPALSSGCLAGITRMLVLQACEEAGIACEEVDLPVDILNECEEAFLTSSTRDVHPIERIDERQLPTPGPVTQAVQKAFAKKYLTGQA